MLDLNPEMVCIIIAKAREFHAKEEVVVPEEPANPSGDWARQVLADHADDLTWQEILGPVNTCMVVATEAIFSQDKAA